jgi:peptidoglycan/LPS O-acetylase OafA/YrhL
MQKNNFDFLRFLFAFLVILAHVYELSAHMDALRYLGKVDSFIPVAGFFIISGFLITQSYNRSKSLGDYFGKRARRLLPAYVFIILICAIGMSLISTFSIADYFGNGSLYRYIISNLVFLNFLHPCLPGVFDHNVMCAINGSLWTIKIEVSFYMVLPLLCYLIKRTGKTGLLLTIMYIGALIHNYVLYKIFQKMPDKGDLYFTLTHQLPALMPYFVSGMVLHFYFDKVMLYKNKLVLIAIPIFLIEYMLNYEILRPLALSIIVFYLAYSFKMFNNWGKYGDFSYGIYIFHFPVIQLIINDGLFEKFNPVMILFLIIFIVIVTAVLSWNLLEKRFLKRKVA